MTTLTHTDVRDALLADERAPEVEHHLAGCLTCRRFDAGLAEVKGVAGGFDVPPVPPGLADRVIERVRAGGGPAARPPALRRWRPVLLPAAGVAAAVVLVLAGLALAGNSNTSTSTAQPILLAAAQRTEAAGPAQVTVEGSAEVTVDAPSSGAPDFSEVPAEMQATLEARWAQLEADFNRQMEEFERRMDEFGRRVDEQFGHIGESFGGQPAEPAEPRQPAQPTPPARPTQPTPPARPTQPARPERLAVRVAISGSGALDAGQGLHVQGSVRPEAGGRAGAFELSARGDAETVRRPDGTWVRYDGAAGPLGLLFQSGGVGAVLRAGGEARLVGRTTIDGATVDEYAFTIDALPGAGASGRWTVHAFVDGRKLVRRMSVQATGALGRETGYATSLTLNLSRFGRATVPTGPAGVSAHVSATSRSSVVLGPLAPGARAALGG